MAQLLSAQKDHAYKVKAYQRAAARIRHLSESLDEMVRDEQDLTQFAGIGDAVVSAVRKIVRTGTLSKLETLRAGASPPSSASGIIPALIRNVSCASTRNRNLYLRNRLESGEIEKVFDARIAYHVRQGLTQTHVMLLYHADTLRDAIEEFLITRCAVERAEVAGDDCRRVEVIEELVFVMEAHNFAAVIPRMQRYGGRMPLVSSESGSALFSLSPVFSCDSNRPPRRTGETT